MALFVGDGVAEGKALRNDLVGQAAVNSAPEASLQGMELRDEQQAQNLSQHHDHHGQGK